MKFYFSPIDLMLGRASLQKYYLPVFPNRFNDLEARIKSKFEAFIAVSNTSDSRLLVIGIYILPFIKNILSAKLIFSELEKRSIRPIFGNIYPQLKNFYKNDEILHPFNFMIKETTIKKKIKKLVKKDYFNILQEFNLSTGKVAYIDYQSQRDELIQFSKLELNYKAKIIELNNVKINEEKEFKTEIGNIVNGLMILLKELSMEIGISLSKQILGNCQNVFESYFSHCYTIQQSFKRLKLESNVFVSGALNNIYKRAFADLINYQEGEVHVLMHGHPFVHKNDTLSWLDLSLSTHFYLYSKIAADCMQQIINNYPPPNNNSPEIKIYCNKQLGTTIIKQIGNISSEDAKKIMFIGGITRNPFQINSYVYPNYINAYIEYKIIEKLKKNSIEVVYKNRPEQKQYAKTNFAYFEDVKQIFKPFEEIENLPLNILLYSTRSTLLKYLISTTRNIIIFELENELLCDNMKEILDARVYFITVKMNYTDSEILFDNSELEQAMKDYKNKRSHWQKVSSQLI